MTSNMVLMLRRCSDSRNSINVHSNMNCKGRYRGGELAIQRSVIWPWQMWQKGRFKTRVNHIKYKYIAMRIYVVIHCMSIAVFTSIVNFVSMSVHLSWCRWFKLCDHFHCVLIKVAIVGRKHTWMKSSRNIVKWSDQGEKQYRGTFWFAHSWWRHQMEAFSALLALCAGNSPVPGEFPTQRPVTRSFDVFFDLRVNKRLSKQSWGWWFETPVSSLWRHGNVLCNTLGTRGCKYFSCIIIAVPVSFQWWVSIASKYCDMIA